MVAERVGPTSHETIRRWNNLSGITWVRFQRALDAQLSEIGRETLRLAKLREGQRVVDIGCGCGETVLQIAEAIGPSGHVLGIDVSRPMLARAHQRVEQAFGEAQQHIELVEADAAVYPFQASSCDVIYSRLGMMFFPEPLSAFARLRTALAPGGRIAFVCWQGVEANPWMSIPLEAAEQLLPGFKAPQWGPREPGPFALADATQLGTLLTLADFAPLEIESRRMSMPIAGGAGLLEAAELLCELSPAARWLREHEDTQAFRNALIERVAGMLRPFLRGDRVIMTGDVWLVSASP